MADDTHARVRVSNDALKQANVTPSPVSDRARNQTDAQVAALKDAVHTIPEVLDIRDALIAYVVANHPSHLDADSMPLDDSLVELGVVDSYGVVELVSFLETNWSIAILDSEITREKMGSINKMTWLTWEKLRAKRVD